MSWTIREILDGTDELADRFEALDASQLEEVPVAECLLARAARQRERSENRFLDALGKARADGTTWDRIGEILDISGAEAQRRYRTRIDEPEAVRS